MSDYTEPKYKICYYPYPSPTSMSMLYLGQFLLLSVGAIAFKPIRQLFMERK